MPTLRATFLLLLAIFLPACSGSEEATIESAHAVFVVRPGCDYFIARTTGRGYLVASPTDSYRPRQGDLLVGNAGTGERRFGIVPSGTNDMSPAQSVRVVDYDLSIAEAQDLYYGYCPLSTLPDETAADTTGTF